MARGLQCIGQDGKDSRADKERQGRKVGTKGAIDVTTAQKGKNRRNEMKTIDLTIAFLVVGAIAFALLVTELYLAIQFVYGH